MNMQISGVDMHYVLYGSGTKRVVLLHGWGCDRNIWKATSELLRNHFQVVAVDFAGFGQSEEPHEVWGVEEYTRSVEAIARHEGVENPILIGHSFGGRVSILYASRNEVAKVILTDAAGVKPHRTLNYYRKVYTFKLMKHLLPWLIGQKKAQMLIEQRRKASASSDYNQATPMMRAILSKCVNEDLKHVMPLIKAPTLLIWGENDTATPLSDAKTMEKLIPDAGLVSFPGCGHYSFLDNPVGYKAVIKEFLKNELK